VYVAFLRVKKIKGKEYCYVVENKWTKKKGARQTVKEYLGPVVRCEIGQLDFNEFNGIKDIRKFYIKKKVEIILKDIILWELSRAGFVEDSQHFRKDDVEVSKRSFLPNRNGRGVVLALNEGYFCPFTVKKILKFDKSGDMETDGIPFARLFVDAGLMPPPEVMVVLYQKLRK
jgi:hypothetical protein